MRDDALSKRFTLIEMADQEAEKILEDARSEATQALGQAAREADQIRVSAQAYARRPGRRSRISWGEPGGI